MEALANQFPAQDRGVYRGAFSSTWCPLYRLFTRCQLFLFLSDSRRLRLIHVAHCTGLVMIVNPFFPAGLYLKARPAVAHYTELVTFVNNSFPVRYAKYSTLNSPPFYNSYSMLHLGHPVPTSKVKYVPNRLGLNILSLLAESSINWTELLKSLKPMRRPRPVRAC